MHQDGSMELDAKMKRACFIENSTEIREMFGFANPSHVLSAAQAYTCHFSLPADFVSPEHVEIAYIDVELMFRG